MKPENIEDIYELTPIQKGILFHSLYDSENGLYFFQTTFTLKGFLDLITFERAWQTVVQRHTALRTGFYWQDVERPLQVVYKQVQVPFEYLDWREIAPAEQQQQLSSFLVKDRASGFDLAQPCLMHLTILHLADDIYECIWSRHFIIADGWSIPLILDEVIEIYQSLSQERDIFLTPGVPFRSYIDWLQRQNLNQAETFWRGMLKGIKKPTPLISLYTDAIDEGEKKYDDRQIVLSQKMTTALHSLAKSHQLTVNTIIQGIWAILLSYYSGQQKVVYGCTVSGRPPELKGVESIAGMLVNTLPVTIDVDPEQFFLPWLKQLQELLVEIRQYEYSPLVEVQGWSEIPRSLPLFESFVVFENLPEAQGLQENDLVILDSNNFYKTNYPINIVIIPDTSLTIGINYDFNRVTLVTVDGILAHFKIIIENIIMCSNTQIKDLSVLSQEEQRNVRELNDKMVFNFDLFGEIISV